MDRSGTPPPRLIRCPQCGIPARPADTTALVRFPHDLDAVERVVVREFNAFRHFCGRWVDVPVAGRVTWPDRQRTILFGTADDVAGPPDGWVVAHVEDYDDLRLAVLGWLAEESAALWSMVEDGSLLALDPAERIAAVTPVRLLAWSFETDGRRLAAQSPLDVDHATQVDALFTAILVDQLRSVALQAARDSRIEDLVDLVRQAVPARCLTPELLDVLRDGCDDRLLSPPFTREELAAGFRVEFTCAAAHVVAGRDNPRLSSWASVLATFWAWSRRDGRQVDDRFFLDARALQATCPFPDLLAAAARIGLPERSRSLDVVHEFSDTFSGLMDRAGYGELFREQVNGIFTQALVRSRPTTGPVELYGIARDAMLRDPVEGLTIGDVAAGFADRWTQALPDRTAEIVTGLFAQLQAHGTFEERCHFVSGATVWLNARHEWAVSETIVDALLVELEVGEPELSPGERVTLWNEIGNTFRYLGAHEHALAAYSTAELGCAGLPDEQVRRAIVARNRAIVLRDSGRLREAEALLLALVAEQPDDPGLLHSLAVFYDRIGSPQRAAEPLSRALAQPTVSPATAALLLASRAQMHRDGHRDDAAMADLQHAWVLQPESSLDARLRIAAVAATCRPSEAGHVAFREELVAFALDRAPAVAHLADGAGLVALVAVAEVALRRGDAATARAALEIVLPAPRDPAGYRVGQVAIDWAWLLVLEGSASDALPWLVSGMRSVESAVPSGEDARFAITWIGGATAMIDRMLAIAPRVTTDPSLLIGVYEIANGRELTAAQPVEDVSDWAGHLGRAARDAHCDVVVLLDGTDGLTSVVVPASGAEPVVQDIALTAVELDRAVERLDAFDRANPVAPHRIDRGLAEWWRVAGVLADAVRPHLGTGTEVVFLPGRRLASTPLHLAGWPDAPLIAERPVAVCPNARTLLAPQPAGDGSVGVVAVPKAADSAPFRTALRAAAAEIAAGAGRGRVLAESAADEDAVLALAAENDEIVFLCHGLSSSGPGRGPGICVAAGGFLPPSPLPVEADPELDRFALNWTDLLELDRGPRIVVSMACSTGRSLVGAGGSRIGLEQGFLTRGGNAIVSPLWNIDQEPSLAWLRAFSARHVPGTSADLGVAHRLACLDVRATHPHPFAWGPFLLTRRLRGDR